MADLDAAFRSGDAGRVGPAFALRFLSSRAVGRETANSVELAARKPSKVETAVCALWGW